MSGFILNDDGYRGRDGREKDFWTSFVTDWLCCTNGVRDSSREYSVIADCHEQLVPYEVQDQELAFVQRGAEAARFAINLV